MKILLITAAFPPVGGSHMQRMLNLANYLIEDGHEVNVIAYKPSDDYPNIDINSIKDVSKRIKIWYVQEGFLHRKIRNKVVISQSNDLNKSKTKKFKKVLFNYRKKMLIPDPLIDWLPEVIKYEKRFKIVEQIKPDLIISSSMPNTAHIIGYQLSKKYKVPLMMDYGDPWTYEVSIERGIVRRNIDYFIESRIIKHSQMITVATENTRMLYINKFKVPESKISTFMMGYIPTQKLIANKETSYSPKISFIYGGMLNPIHRNPIPFIEAINNFSSFDVECKFRTNVSKDLIEKFTNTKSLVRVEPLIPFDQFIEELYAADVLVLFGNSTPIQIAGKVFNYMSTGKHILYIKNMPKDIHDPVEKIMEEYGNSTIVQNNNKEIYKSILNLIDLKKNGDLKIKHSEKIDKYTWESQVFLLSRNIRRKFT